MPDQHREEAMTLLPCPFCGGKAELREDLDYHTGKPNGKWWAICPPCDLIRDQGFCVSRDEAITAWNTRTPDPRIEVLERALAYAHGRLEQLRIWNAVPIDVRNHCIGSLNYLDALTSKGGADHAA
jgi:hypothetical protein